MSPNELAARVAQTATVVEAVATAIAEARRLDVDGATSFGLPSVLEDGSVYFEFLVTDHNWVESTQPGFDFCEPFRYEIGADLRLGTVTPAGEFSSTTLQTYPHTISCFIGHGACASPVRDVDLAQFSDVIPDGHGGALAAWRAVNASALPRITRVNAGSAVEYGIPFASFQSGSASTLSLSLVLGEEGVAFASNGATAIAFEVATGAARWSWTPPRQPSGALTGVQLITSTAGNGLVVVTHDNSGFPFFGTVARLDSAGQATFDSWSATGIEYAFGNLWLGQGSLLAIEAPGVTYSTSLWQRPAQKGTRQSRLLEFVYFIPDDPGRPNDPNGFLTAQVARDEIKRILSSGRVTHRFLLKKDATSEAFLDELPKQNDAVAFFGHSLFFRLTETSPQFAAGLCFHDLRCLARTPNPSVPLLNYGSLLTPKDKTVDRLKTQAKVVFIASCALTEVFSEWWDINSSTEGRALVASTSRLTDLVQGVAAWTVLGEELLKGKTVQQAVDAVNLFMAQQDRMERWQVVGDPNVRTQRQK